MMKKLMMLCATFGVVCAMAQANQKASGGDNVDPVANVKLEAKDPNPYSDYGVAMKSTPEKPLLSDWQVRHAKEIKEATTDKILNGFLSSDKAADELLAKVKEAYKTDPITMIQIASVTQRALKSCCNAKSVWVSALKRAQKNAPDKYRERFYHDQLYLCGEK